MSLDTASCGRDARAADDLPDYHAVRSAPEPGYLPPPGIGYARRPPIRSKVVAFLIAAALHGAALTGFMLYRFTEVPVAPPPRSLIVTSLPLARPPAARPMRAVQPKPVPVTLRQPPPVSIVPIIQPRAPDVVDPLFSRPAPAPPEPVAAAVAPAAAAPPVAHVAEMGGDAKDNWEGRILARLERYKHFPEAARSGREQGVATIRFRLDRRGRVLSASIARGSGSAILDQAALATLARAAPFPAIPAGRPDEIDLVVPVEFALHRGR